MVSDADARLPIVYASRRSFPRHRHVERADFVDSLSRELVALLAVGRGRRVESIYGIPIFSSVRPHGWRAILG